MFLPQYRYLLAVSGGRDSVVLEHIARTECASYVIAHCNFHLRPGDCDRDEAFVRQLAGQSGVACFVAQFDTQSFATMHKLSVEEAARKLRYEWFEQLRQQQHCDYVVTAHHRDDDIETFFLNLLRGTGIAGLRGMRQLNGKVLRPLLEWSRADINAYVDRYQLQYVEDATNASVQYRRNQIRHQLLPMLRQMSPSFDDVMCRNMRHLSDVERVYQTTIGSLREQLLQEESNGVLSVDINLFKHYQAVYQLQHATLMYELLKPYGVSPSLSEDILSVLDAVSGKQFQTPTHTIVKDRNRLLIQPLDRVEVTPSIHQELIPAPQVFDGSQFKCRDAAFFDADKIAQPITLRHWLASDRFYPYGMSGSQLLSDYFSNNKYSLIAKRTQWLLVDAEDRILWIVGQRSDRRFGVTSGSVRILKVTVG
ncbi:MAG: tRNA lysidine(34) synthetase TilS [Bacteroidales bacterium]|nr:tRNA lysidine(34) synthetase TilS [Candidatus Colimorpha onthohippi]